MAAAGSPRIDAYAVLSDAPPTDRVAIAAELALSDRDPPLDCPAYRAALRKAVSEEPPPFSTEAYAKIYRDSSVSGKWLAISLISNAQREGQGAGDLWTLAACADNEAERQLIKRHAVDESRHARLYLALLDLAFPDAVDPAFRKELDVVSPGFTMAQEPSVVVGSPYATRPTIDLYVQMNIAEIRTTIHHLLQRAALALHCPAANLPRATKVLDSLFRDELSHVSYTAELIETKASAAGPGGLDGLYRRRLADFNRITNDEFGMTIHD